MNSPPLLTILIAGVSVFAACFAQRRINLKRINRARQAAMPMLALIYVAVASYFLIRFKAPLNDFLDNFGLARYGSWAMNLGLILGFAALKFLLLPLISAVWKNDRLIKATSSHFYDYDQRFSMWFVLQPWSNARQVWRALTFASAVLTVALMVLSYRFNHLPVFSLLYFPAAILVVVGEIYNFLNGYTRLEFEHRLHGDDVVSKRISNYFKIREIFEKLFAPRLLVSYTGSDSRGKKSAAHLIESLEEGDAVEQVVARYFSGWESQGPPDADYVMATNRLMHKESLVIINPFYRDSGPYLALPIANTLLTGKKCLVIAGRNACQEDLINWLNEEMAEFSKLDTLWRVKPLDKREPDCEIGVLNFAQLYDHDILRVNSGFFKKVEFVLLIEPSLLVNTGQIGLSIIASEIEREDGQPVFCILDRPVEGLVDTLSHLLHVELTEVIAPPLSKGLFNGMAWESGGEFFRQRLFDKQTRFLGNGVELAATAVKNQIPRVTWYSETKAPVRDIRWLAGQQYTTICNYMNLPAQQNNLYDKIKFVSNIWNAPVGKEEFLIVEDEFCHMFNMMQVYLSRGEDQTFVNILSENYLLRDYMRYNSQLFLTNPASIPSLVPDYAKTLKNTVIKLILKMVVEPVSEVEIADELRLAGVETKDPFNHFVRLVRQYTLADQVEFKMHSQDDHLATIAKEKTNYFSIDQEAFDHYFEDSLKNAYFVIEDEKSGENYIDAKLYGHVTQTILPGQLITYDGKYYQAKAISAKEGIILRRASDLYDSRKYYRQIRNYTFGTDLCQSITSIKSLMDIEIAYLQGSLRVDTNGYLEMYDNHDLRTARQVDFSEDSRVGTFTRRYRDKTVLRIGLPETDEKIRYTLAMLLSETLRSIFPQSWPYLAVLAVRPEDIGGMLNYTTYTLEGEVEESYIYIVEDSYMDLGLLEAIERNLIKLLEIIADFLDWHFEKMREPASLDPVLADVEMPEKKEAENFRRRLLNFFKNIFKRPSKPTEEAKAPEPTEAQETPVIEDRPEIPEYGLDDTPTHQPEDLGLPFVPEEEDSQDSEDYLLEEGTNGVEAEEPEESLENDPEGTDDPPILIDLEVDADLEHMDGTDIFDETDLGSPVDNDYLDNQFRAAGIIPFAKSRYQEECYLKYGFEEIDSRIRLDETFSYLRLRGFTNNALTKARLWDPHEEDELNLEEVNQCDFCGVPLTGVYYERINDGRVRCQDCASTAIESYEEFKKILDEVLHLMECFFKFELNIPITIKVTDAKTVARGAGSVFRPSNKKTARVLGYARRRGNVYEMVVENGCPRNAFIDTMVHELTHIWQYINWKEREIISLYGKENEDYVYEGMAVWTSVQYLYQIGEKSFARLQEMIARQRGDTYGVGFNLYESKYPLEKSRALLVYTPFVIYPPL